MGIVIYFVLFISFLFELLAIEVCANVSVVAPLILTYRLFFRCSWSFLVSANFNEAAFNADLSSWDVSSVTDMGDSKLMLPP